MISLDIQAYGECKLSAESFFLFSFFFPPPTADYPAVTAGSSEMSQVGATFLQLRLVLNKGTRIENVYMGTLIIIDEEAV